MTRRLPSLDAGVARAGFQRDFKTGGVVIPLSEVLAGGEGGVLLHLETQRDDAKHTAHLARGERNRLRYELEEAELELARAEAKETAYTRAHEAARRAFDG